jgi:hypothetical protein
MLHLRGIYDSKSLENFLIDWLFQQIDPDRSTVDDNLISSRSILDLASRRWPSQLKPKRGFLKTKSTVVSIANADETMGA